MFYIRAVLLNHFWNTEKSLVFVLGIVFHQVKGLVKERSIIKMSVSLKCCTVGTCDLFYFVNQQLTWLSFKMSFSWTCTALSKQNKYFLIPQAHRTLVISPDVLLSCVIIYVIMLLTCFKHVWLCIVTYLYILLVSTKASSATSLHCSKWSIKREVP